MRGCTANSRHRRAGALAALLLPAVPALAAADFAAPIVTAQGAADADAQTQAPGHDQPKNGSPVEPEHVEPLPPSEGAAVLGKKVKGPSGEDLGLIVDVLIDPDGKPHAAVIDFGGFLGVGSRKIAIDWKALDFTPLARSGTVKLGLDRGQIAAAPEYKPGPPGAAVVTAPPAPPPPADTHR